MPRPDSIDQITAPPKQIPEPRAKVNATARKTMLIAETPASPRALPTKNPSTTE